MLNINKSTMGNVLDLSEEKVLIVDDDSDVSNSFFETRYHGFKILVLAPNPSDELSVAGAMILNLIKSRAEVFVAFMNGTSIKNTKITSREVENSLKILGINRDHIVYLDSDDILSALKGLLIELEADVIFCTDFDIPNDHRKLSIYFERAIYEILSRADNKYQPEIYKGFAYTTAFAAIQDLHSENLLETKKPSTSVEFDLIDRVNYTWSDRVRFPVYENCRKTLIQRNPIAKAIFAYKSQRNEWNTLGIINSDKVFFERRTDNLAYSAEISATSGDFQRVCDFHIINAENINENKTRFCNHIWKPDENDNEKRLTLSWKNLQQIEQIKIYGDINSENTYKINISLDKSYFSRISLPEHGRPYVIDFSEVIFASKVELQLEGEGAISEIEIFSERESRRVIKPFIKITIDDNFVYDYFIPKFKKRIELEIYRFHISKTVEMSVSDGVLYYSGKTFIVQFDSDDVTVRAEVAGEPEIFDQIKIHRKSLIYFWKLRLKQIIERMNIYLRNKFKFLR